MQRLCEELEYSELLDKAAELDDPYERMVYVAAFAVSCYASSCYRAGNKPFNPLLGETYECVREDKGFKFLGEQVSIFSSQPPPPRFKSPGTPETCFFFIFLFFFYTGFTSSSSQCVLRRVEKFYILARCTY